MELYCIHLRQQPGDERLKTHLSELGEICLNVVDGIYNSRGNIGCAIFKKIIQYAIIKIWIKLLLLRMM